MNYLLIPISNLVLDHVIKLNEVIIFPCYHENFSMLYYDLDIKDEEIKTLKNLIKLNKDFINSCGDLSINLAMLKIQYNINCIDNIDSFLEKNIYHVNKLLDYIRIQYCNFNNKETLIGIPGLINNYRQAFYFDYSLNLIKSIKGKQILYSMQPGIGVDISIYPGWKDNEIYSALINNRNDEVYLEFRTILSRACYSMHIIDINRCFCYLFSTVERMGSQKYCKFEERKKRIISFISDNQEKFDSLSSQFYFYSKSVRTEIIHKGKNILDIIPIDKANQIINNLFLLIVRFSLKVINSNIYTFNDLENSLQEALKRFNYKTPNLPKNDFIFESILDDTEFTFIAPINNLSFNKILKLGDALFIPKDSAKTYCDKLPWVYSQFELGESLENIAELETSDHKIIDLSEFKDLSEDCILTIQSALSCKEIFELNQKSPIAIIFNQPYLNNSNYDFVKSFEFCDYLCNNINKQLSYLILSNCDIRDKESLPSQAGILNTFRILYHFDYIYNSIDSILGRIYNQYIESDKLFIIPDNFKITDKILYRCLYNNRNDEISFLCTTALTRLCECYYINDYTIMVSYLFDILDMLDPEDTEGTKLKSHVLPFACNTKNEYYQACNQFKKIRIYYRNPLIHSGKSIYDLISTDEEIYKLFDYMKNIIISFCKTVFSSNAKTFDELEIEREKRKRYLNL